MSPGSAATGRERRLDRRVEVRLPMEIRGTDRAGHSFLDNAESVNVSRRGAAFILGREIEAGASIEIRIQRQRGNAGKDLEEFTTVGRVVHVRNTKGARGLLIGVEFTGRSFPRIFVPESSKE